MIPRTAHLTRLERLLGQFPIVGLIGARQVGKTTLARVLAASSPAPASFFDLESPADALGSLSGLVVVDEIQNRPDLFPLLRVLADRAGTPARFLVLGSASPALLRQSSSCAAPRGWASR